MSKDRLPTVGQIARQLDVPVHRIEYLIRTRNIQHVGRAGIARVYDAKDVEALAEELRRIKDSRGGRSDA
ncbi:MAG: hypothetical protein RIE32_03960 [Phycisphaerales bacterium]